MINMNLLTIDIDSRSLFGWQIWERSSSQAQLHLKSNFLQKRFDNLFVNIIVYF
jgi:hypothetical protein